MAVTQNLLQARRIFLFKVPGLFGHLLTFLKLLSVLSLSERWTYLSVCPLQQEMNFEKVGFNNKCLSTL